MSADAENEYFADGISEELLNVLVKVEDIGVASRTSSFAYKGRELGAAVIAEQLKVNHILEGSVRKAGNRVRITAQLIDAVNDRHLWSETYDRELTDIFAIQDEIANAIVAALRGTLVTDQALRTVTVRADTDDLDAYQLYLKARELFLTRVRLDESVRLFEQVVALDPEFARGWEGLATASAVIISWVDEYISIDRQALIRRSEQAAERALALDPGLSMPWVARSVAARGKDFSSRLDLVERAIVADPKNATAYLVRSIIWIELGFFDRALADLDQCLSIDPAYGNGRRWKAITLLVKGEVDLALELYTQGIAAGFNTSRANSFVEPLIRRGNRFAAILLMRDLGWPVDVQQAVVAALGDGAAPPDVAALVRRNPQIPRAQFQWGLLLRDYAIAAEQEVLGSLVEHWDPAYEGLRESPAFKRIIERMGAPAYWREHGYPPQCRPVGADDFECLQ
jgi:adenylate cyclase